MKKNRIFDFTMLITSFICLIPVFIGIILWDKLPDSMVRHFNANIEPNGWSSKTTVVLLFPLLFLAISLFVNLLINIVRKTNQTEASKLDTIIKYTISIIDAMIFIFIYLFNLGPGLITGEQSFTLVAIVCGILFMVIGNYIPKAKDLVGISLPGIAEKLSTDKELWFRVKRIWGRSIIICSILIIITAFCPTPWNIILFMVWVFAFAFSPYVLVAVFKRK